MLTIWGRANALNVQKVMWAAEEVEHPHQRIDAGFGFGLTDTPTYREINPNGRVPAIVDDGVMLWESNVIVRYLCARYGAPELYPSDLVQRMDGERWMDWQATDVLQAYRPAYNVLSRAGNRHTAEEAEASYAKTLSLLSILDAQLVDSAYVAADHFTMADIPLGVLVNDVVRIGREIEGLPHLQRWYARVRGRPAADAAMSVKIR